jgi:hypothetical protein
MQEMLPDLPTSSWAVTEMKYYTAGKEIIGNVALQNCLLEGCGNVPWLLTNPTVRKYLHMFAPSLFKVQSV